MLMSCFNFLGVIILAKNITKIVEYTYVKDITDRWCK